MIKHKNIYSIYSQLMKDVHLQEEWMSSGEHF